MPKASKYRNKKTLIDDIAFDSKKEAMRYCELKLLVKSGDVTDLELQKTYELIPKQKLSSGKAERACKYVADFCFIMDGKVVVEDVKGMKRGQAYDLFTIKRKLMKFIHGIEVIEI